MGKYNRDQNCWSRGEVSDARLHQHSGPQHAFGGWEKVSNARSTARRQRAGHVRTLLRKQWPTQ